MLWAVEHSDSGSDSCGAPASCRPSTPLLLGTLLYRSGLVPRCMPAIGLIGAPMLISSTVGIFFDVNEVLSPWRAIATARIFVWELSIGLWMTFKGFRATAPVLAWRPSAAVTPVTAKAGAA